MLNDVGSIELSVIERIVRGLHTVANAMEEAPIEKWWVALEAAENSYLDTLRASGFSGLGPHRRVAITQGTGNGFRRNANPEQKFHRNPV